MKIRLEKNATPDGSWRSDEGRPNSGRPFKLNENCEESAWGGGVKIKILGVAVDIE